ncbi:unnamed protein product [Paramecium octaurelia]|uniref:Uncharacterized protein n=1 Tax=Paramecium octaurelia TaxID=43137 RepID=A0A8S1XYC7_PAROT|nr:unnamed protein product [Paramecium octaurelia]
MGQCLNCFKKNEECQQDVVSQQANTNSKPLNEYQTETITFNKQSIVITNDSQKINVTNFKLLKTIGRGNFGKVLLVRKRTSGKIYAMKIVNKQDLQVKKQVEYAKTERIILEKINHPFISKLHYAFQTQQKLYYVIDYCAGGELFFHLRRAYKFKENQVQFYAVEIIIALEYLHDSKILYRDLKPENILLCSDGHIKLIDFGLSKIISNRDKPSFSIVGTPEYLAPEIYSDDKLGHDESCDWWSLGALMYEMLTGAAPFYSQDRTMMFRNRTEKQIEMKPWFSEACSSVLTGLLNNNPKQRINIQQIKKHPFFADIDWNQASNRQLIPPIIPELSDELDLRYFNKMFLDEPAIDSPVNKKEQYDNYDYFTYDSEATTES